MAYCKTQPYSPYECTAVEGGLDVQYYLRKHNDELLVTFRGSDSYTDWITNFLFYKQTIPYGNISSKIRVHAGFLKAYKASDVRNRILGSIPETVNYIRVTGHSLGAALATLCAVDIQYNFPNKNIEVILFGSPRIGNKAFKLSYNKRLPKTVRVENGNDLVTKIPFPWMGYRHVGAELHIGRPRFIGVGSVHDHAPVQYYSSLLQCLLPDCR